METWIYVLLFVKEPEMESCAIILQFFWTTDVDEMAAHLFIPTSWCA